MNLRLHIIFLCVISSYYLCSGATTQKWPTVGISVLVRNKAHTLPYFFSCLELLDYPKDRMYIWIHSDFNADNSDLIIEVWERMLGHQYNSVYISTNASSGPLHADESVTTLWTQKRYQHVIHLKEQALRFAEKRWADYIFVLDADVFLTNPNTLKLLVKRREAIIAPMLSSEGMYSNFWCGMTDEYYYMRTAKYEPIMNRDVTGCFKVPMVFGAVLVSLNEPQSENLTYDPHKLKDYNGPEDDIIVFALSAQTYDLPLHICNDRHYGYMLSPLDDQEHLRADADKLLNIKLAAIADATPLPLLPIMEEFVQYPKPSKLGFDEIFMINLDRREERRRLMELSFKELGMDVKRVSAIDGRKLEASDLKDIKFMENYQDPYHKRKMKAGEVGCFLSHYNIWKEIVDRDLSMVMVLEDDIRFSYYFQHLLKNLMDSIKDVEWDFLYLGRKSMSDHEEERASPLAVRPGYSYWTVGYLLTKRGAEKLLAARPLDNLLPADEYIPIMFDQHPMVSWREQYAVRDLLALAAEPALVQPARYVHDSGYVSDTEDSLLVERLSRPLFDQLQFAIPDETKPKEEEKLSLFFEDDYDKEEEDSEPEPEPMELEDEEPDMKRFGSTTVEKVLWAEDFFAARYERAQNGEKAAESNAEPAGQEPADPDDVEDAAEEAAAEDPAPDAAEPGPEDVQRAPGAGPRVKTDL